MKEKTWGAFCEIMGINPRNRVIELFLEGREIDFATGDVARIIGMNRATTYNTIKELLDEGFIIFSRKVSGSQLYQLNLDKPEVKLLIKAFSLVLENMVSQYKVPQKKRRVVA